MRSGVGAIVIVASFAVFVLAFAGCGETETTGASGADVAGFVTILVTSLGSCEGLAGAAQDFEANTSGNVDFQQEADEFQRFADAVPDEIKDDVQVIADAYSKSEEAYSKSEESYSKFEEELEGLDLTSTPDPEELQELEGQLQESQEQLQEFSTGVDRQEMEQATRNISAWVRQNCS